ncbi:GyrI-like domain-containing protein [Sinorhizobium terangae]|uniref:AraC family transcriptional regulator n=1 Tax=Sinorhizobium terangae TaxID=110322 RepID=A0A6N7LDF0_SINTE|nr:GyrI-like domain-containing protein [Sinorhizobium terangae]MBB4188339.1 putative transcriptional regulator YdeE [Sinorhizobium terangae]MQX15310.1 AraC family transcriptional regulator [Sinorhizobium terangae]WFU46659.1 GyrI-like domain-containing protein [Sinorhizobium terangae]
MVIAFEIVERPAQTITGHLWEGTFIEAADGAVRRLIAETQEHRRRAYPDDHSALIGLSWNDRSDGFRYLVGYAGEDDGTFTQPQQVELPAMRLATTIHRPESSDVFADYSKMFDWIAAEGHIIDTTHFHYREEYEAGFVSPAASSLRLMVPIR